MFCICFAIGWEVVGRAGKSILLIIAKHESINFVVKNFAKNNLVTYCHAFNSILCKKCGK